MHFGLSRLAFWRRFSKKSQAAHAEGPEMYLIAPVASQTTIGQAPLQAEPNVPAAEPNAPAAELNAPAAVATALGAVATAPEMPLTGMATPPIPRSLQRIRNAAPSILAYLSADAGVMPITRKAKHLHAAWKSLTDVDGAIRTAYRTATQSDRYIIHGSYVSMPEEIPSWLVDIQDLMWSAQGLDWRNMMVRETKAALVALIAEEQKREREERQTRLLFQSIWRRHEQKTVQQKQPEQPVPQEPVPQPPAQQVQLVPQQTTTRKATFDSLPKELKMMIWKHVIDVPQCRYFYERFNFDGEHQPGMRFAHDAALWNVNTEWRDFMRHAYAKMGARISREGCLCSRYGRPAVSERKATMELHWRQISFYNDLGINYRDRLADVKAAVLALVVSLDQWVASVQQTDPSFAVEVRQAYADLRRIGTVEQELRQLHRELNQI